MMLMELLLDTLRPILPAALLKNTGTANADLPRTARVQLESVLSVNQGGTVIRLVVLLTKVVYPV